MKSKKISKWEPNGNQQAMIESAQPKANVFNHHRRLLVAGMLALLFVIVLPVFGNEATTRLFTEKCSGCHTIGGGDTVGPDLSKSARYTDSDLQAAVKRMEANVGPLNDDEVSQLVQFIKDPAAAQKLKGGGETPTTTTASTADVTPGPVATGGSSAEELGSAERGADLFSGRTPLKNGGVSCIACHKVEGMGGTLGKDLTTVASKMSFVALASASEQTAFKIMRPVYKEHKVSRQEALDIARYLVTVNEKVSMKKDPPVFLIGLGIAVLIIALIVIGYRNRNKSKLRELKGS